MCLIQICFSRYAPPHPAAVWPLCANILDPVRLSLVVEGPARLLDVAMLFTGAEDDCTTGLPVLRVKNLFALSRSEVPDGYRDIKLFVAFTGSNGLGIIGEIQVCSL
jgi:hypothetical protein